MAAIKVNVFPEAIKEFGNDPTGPIGAQLLIAAESIVIPDAIDALSVPATRFPGFRLGGDGAGQRYGSWAPNPPEGPPRERSGDLKHSLKTVGPMHDERGLVVYGTADAIHRGFAYANHLRDRGYKFLPPDDPRYIYHEQVGSND